MTTTTLPRITPMSTPLPTGITQPPPRSHTSASLYVPYPPKELSSSLDYLKVPQRINPLAPTPPRRRINWSWETTDQHHHNEKRSLLMQKREHTRYHSAWSKAFYGSPAEKEAYRRHFREVLKQQMSDKMVMEKEEFKQKVRETEQAIAYDRDCRVNDAKEYFRKHNYLMQYRDGNKQQMEEKWAYHRYNRELENRIDRERLRYNPINWSCTLK